MVQNKDQMSIIITEVKTRIKEMEQQHILFLSGLVNIARVIFFFPSRTTLQIQYELLIGWKFIVGKLTNCGIIGVGGVLKLVDVEMKIT